MCKSCRLEQVLRRSILHSEDKSTKCQSEYVCVEVLVNTVIAAPPAPIAADVYLSIYLTLRVKYPSYLMHPGPSLYLTRIGAFRAEAPPKHLNTSSFPESRDPDCLQQESASLYVVDGH